MWNVLEDVKKQVGETARKKVNGMTDASNPFSDGIKFYRVDLSLSLSTEINKERVKIPG